MFERYAVYYTPDRPLAQAGAAWLGWDVAKGDVAPHPDIGGLDVAALTATPRKYGLHGTVKPPFVLADGRSVEELKAALVALCARLAPVSLPGLQVSNLAGFIALTPVGDQTALAGMAAQVVTQLDAFRAPASPAELARRRQAGLSPAQEQHLVNWGYPYVMDQFRFHITLTGKTDAADRYLEPIAAHFAPYLPAPFKVDSLTLAGQRADGMFCAIHRYPLTG